MKFRYGVVPYMNAKPLCWTLKDVRAEHPPELLKLLEHGKVDAALLSSIEYLRRPDLFDYIRGMGVCSDGPVASVRLYIRRTSKSGWTLALDPHSLTANSLARLYFKHRRGGVEPSCVQRRGDDWTGADATVVIGDDALSFEAGEYIDLGAEWKSWTGLPFVWALWICRRGADLGAMGKELERAYSEGRERVQEIAEREADRLSLDKSICLRYFQNNVRYPMGPREEKGMELFGSYLKELGLI